MADDTERRDPWAVDGTTVSRSPVTPVVPHPEDPEDKGFVNQTPPLPNPYIYRDGDNNPNSGDPHPDDPHGFGYLGDHGHQTEYLARYAYHRAHFGEGKTVEDAAAVAKAETGLAPSNSVADIEEWEAEHPDEIAAAREHWEAIVADEASPEPTTDGTTQEGQPVTEEAA
jgi:hypothetical protein